MENEKVANYKEKNKKTIRNQQKIAIHEALKEAEGPINESGAS